MEPFIHPGVPAYVINAAEKSAEQQIVQLRGWSTRLHLSLDLHAPTLLLPQKSSSPNLIVLNMGEFTIRGRHSVSEAMFIGLWCFFVEVLEFLQREIMASSSSMVRNNGREAY